MSSGSRIIIHYIIIREEKTVCIMTIEHCYKLKKEMICNPLTSCGANDRCTHTLTYTRILGIIYTYIICIIIDRYTYIICVQYIYYIYIGYNVYCRQISARARIEWVRRVAVQRRRTSTLGRDGLVVSIYGEGGKKIH